MKRAFSFKIDEYPSISKMMRDSFVRDMNDFTAYKPKFNAAFLTALDTKIGALNDLVENKIKIAELKKLTEVLYDETESLRPVLTKIEGFVIDAAGLSVPAKDFRFKEARNGITNRDMEVIILETETIRQLLTDNMSALTAEGYMNTLHTEFSDLIDDIDRKNRDRNLKVDEKEAVVQANMLFLNDLYKDVKLISDTGKRLYKYGNKEKTGDYTMATLLKRISNVPVDENNNAKNNAAIEGKTIDFETEKVLAGVKVWTNNNKTGSVSDKDGLFKIKVNAETLETLYASYAGYTDYEEDMEIDKGVTMELTIEMEKKEVDQ